MMQHALNL